MSEVLEKWPLIVGDAASYRQLGEIYAPLCVEVHESVGASRGRVPLTTINYDYICTKKYM